MLNQLTPEELQELEAEFARLTPAEQNLLDAASIAAEAAIENMNRRLDETLAYLDRAQHFFDATDLARDVHGDNFAASRWLCTPNANLGGKAPLDVLKDEDGPSRVIECLQALKARKLDS